MTTSGASHGLQSTKPLLNLKQILKEKYQAAIIGGIQLTSTWKSSPAPSQSLDVITGV